ncbi:MAG: eukaryotic-like serine/threonine-protein kinase [Acidobacteriota bacterium]|nr:eukaryotic-like serine/threonine-protein kinase [Acidobacteriota bacterium]
MSVSEPVPPSESADSIGAYRILEVLGRGGMGEVFLAWDEGLQRRVAIKRIRHDGEITPTLRQRLLREAQAVAGLSHPAIVHVYELQKDDAGDDCIVMEYVEGRTLAATLVGGPLDPALAVRLAGEVASGLAAAHAAGIVHRDLKAENIIVTPSGHAKILDFGLAKPLVPANGDPTLTMSGLVLGTCRSMSPEQAKGAEVDERSDLFSLGVMLYEMLTGQPPFRGSGALEILTQVISKDPPRVDTVRPAVPSRLGSLIARLLEKEPAFRPHSAAEVVHELAAIEIAAGSSPVLSSEETLSEFPTGYHTPSSPPPSQPLSRSGGASASKDGTSVPPLPYRRLRIAALSVLAVVVLGIAIYYVQPILRHRKVEMSPDREDHRLLEEQVIRSLHNGNSHDSSHDRSGQVPLTSKVRPKDHEAFLKIQNDINTVPAETLLERLNHVITTSPEFLEARTLAADMYLTQFYSKGDTQYLDSAEMLVGQAQALAPADVRPLFLQFKVEMARGRERDARDTLKRLESLKPGDPQLLLLRSNLAESEGKRVEARDDLLKLVKQQSTWENFYFLVDLEARTGRVTDARNHLKQAITSSPDNLWVLEKQATIELLYGDPAQAEVLFRELIDRAPQRVYYTNLGNAEFLLEHYDEARRAFRQALSFEPDNVTATINLADAELALRNKQVAHTLYNEALLHLDSNLLGAGLSPHDQATRAQCLAHLDRFPEAETAIQQALKRSPDDGEVLQAAALIYVVMGERSLAVETIKKALEKGVQPRWFKLPAYASLRDDPEYQRLVGTMLGATPSR